MINFIILGAGKGTRMNSDIPKVLHKIGNRTMLQISIDLCQEWNDFSNKIVSVVAPDMINNFSNLLPENIEFAIQNEQLGTAHAVKCAISKIEKDNPYTIVLYADNPLIRTKTIKKMIESLEKYKAIVLGFILNEKNKYGKLITVQDQKEIKSGEVLDLLKIKEAKEFSEDEIQPKICNSGFLGFRTKDLIDNIDKIDNKNAAGEYYLTEMIRLINDGEKKPICCCLIVENEEVLGVNTQEELKIAEKILISRNEI